MAMSATFFTLAVVAIVDLTGRERWAGILLAIFNTSAAVSALLVGRLMDRFGRRPGLAIGYSLSRGRRIWRNAGQSGWARRGCCSPWRFPSAPASGPASSVGSRSRTCIRATCAGRMVGIIVAAGTLGRHLRSAGRRGGRGGHRLHGGALAPDPLFGAIGLASCPPLRPDPRDLAEAALRTAQARPGRRPLGSSAPPAAVPGGHRLRSRSHRPSMVAVMGITPVVIDGYGGSALAIALVISFHMVGMFAIAPVIGALARPLRAAPGPAGRRPPHCGRRHPRLVHRGHRV